MGHTARWKIRAQEEDAAISGRKEAQRISKK